MRLMLIFYVILIIICSFSIIKRAIVKLLAKIMYKRTIKEFHMAYYFFEDILESDLDAEDILKAKNLTSNLLKIGPVNAIGFKNLKDLRMYMLIAGEYIIEFSSIIERNYNYQYKTEEFDCCMEELRNVRRICISKGERTDYRISLKDNR